MQSRNHNSDEMDKRNGFYFIGNFHKTLPHNEYGEVCKDSYQKFAARCMEIDSGLHKDFEDIAKGGDYLDCFLIDQIDKRKFTAKFTSPLAGAASEEHGPDPQQMEMIASPSIYSKSTAAEMIELYWMAVLRDVPLSELADHTLINDAINELSTKFSEGVGEIGDEGRLRLGLDLPHTNGTLNITAKTIFRSGLPDEEYGPLVSQFFLRDIPYGTQTISQLQLPYKQAQDYLTNQNDWLRAQNTGTDQYQRDYGSCNNAADETAAFSYYEKEKRYISTMRDLARFVNRDALHQAYFNAALFLDAAGAKLDSGNPYASHYKRQGGFATLGGPDLLTLVSEVASRALKVVWRQKWLVHRRCRPEVFGGLVHMQKVNDRNYGIVDITGSTAANKIFTLKDQKTYFLPMAFSAGSPAHPAYGAGHATVAGACVTVLKAWFDEDEKFLDLINDYDSDGVNIGKSRGKERGRFDPILEPGTDSSTPTKWIPKPYDGKDIGNMTVGGELNKIASNVAMGRSMGGVHWRTDNTRSLRLGEAIAIEILRKRTQEYAESPVSFTFRSFDGKKVFIANGTALV